MAGEVINELNKVNSLSDFVRTMREKFQEAASSGFLPPLEARNAPQESYMAKGLRIQYCFLILSGGLLVLRLRNELGVKAMTD